MIESAPKTEPLSAAMKKKLAGSVAATVLSLTAACGGEGEPMPTTVVVEAPPEAPGSDTEVAAQIDAVETSSPECDALAWELAQEGYVPPVGAIEPQAENVEGVCSADSVSVTIETGPELGWDIEHYYELDEASGEWKLADRE